MKQNKIEKIISDDHFRGIKKYKDGYIVARTARGLMYLDKDFNIIKHNNMKGIDYHGLFIDNDLAYVVETSLNAIGIYELENLEKIDEIRLHEVYGKDMNHINDILIIGDSLYASMFSLKENWTQLSRQKIKSGVIAEYSLSERKLIKVHHTGLHKPHSVVIEDKDMFYCDSMEYTVKKNEDIIFKGNGFTRGLLLDKDVLFIGQSNSRLIKPPWNKACGVYIVNKKTKEKEFVELPSTEVYEIILDD